MDYPKLTEDLSQVKGSLAQLQRSINQIVTTIPKFNELGNLIHVLNSNSASNNTDKFVNEKLRSLCFSPPVQLGAKLKQLYENDKLPFLKLLVLLNLKSIPPTTLNYILAYDELSSIKPEDVEFLQELQAEKIAQVDLDIPSLLPIKDSLLYRKVFLDKSFIDPIIAVVNMDNYVRQFNDRLIQRGRVYLRLILAEIAGYKYPTCFVEDIEVIIDKLMDINLLFKFSMIYRLIDQLKYKLLDKLTPDRKIELIGNLFLSYVGGLSIEQLMNDMKIWIYKLYRNILPKVKSSLQSFPTKQLPAMIYSQFNFMFDGTGYRFEVLETDPYVVKLYIKQFSYIGTSAVSEEMAKINAVKELLTDKPAKTKIFIEQLSSDGLEELVARFHKLIQLNNIVVSYDTNSAGSLFHCAVRWNAVTLGIGIDNDQATAIKKGEQSSYNNLRVLLKEEI